MQSTPAPAASQARCHKGSPHPPHWIAINTRHHATLMVKAVTLAIVPVIIPAARSAVGLRGRTKAAVIKPAQLPAASPRRYSVRARPCDIPSGLMTMSQPRAPNTRRRPGRGPQPSRRGPNLCRTQSRSRDPRRGGRTLSASPAASVPGRPPGRPPRHTAPRLVRQAFQANSLQFGIGGGVDRPRPLEHSLHDQVQDIVVDAARKGARPVSNSYSMAPRP